MVSSNNVFSVFALIGFVLVSILLPSHVKARNIGTCAFIVWIGLLCLNGFVNSVVWNSTVTDWTPVWCDISSRLVIGGGIGIQSSCLCIARNLYLVTRNITTKRFSQYQTRPSRAILYDYFFVVGVPILYIVLSYIIQTRRFIIYEEIGCYPALSNTQLGYPVLLIWPFVMSLIIVVYIGVTIRTLMRRSEHYREHMLHDERFGRLLVLVTVTFICSFPPSLLSIVVDAIADPAVPWSGWDAVHADISQVLRIPAAVWQAEGTSTVFGIQFTRWSNVVYAIILFAFFGFTTEAKKSYHVVSDFVTNHIHKLANPKGRKIRNEPFPGHYMYHVLAHPSYTTQRPGYPQFPHIASAFDNLRRISRDLCSLGLSEQKWESNLGLIQTTSHPDSDSDMGHVPFASSVLEQPAPVFDIKSVLRCHPPESNLGFDQALPHIDVP